MIKSKNKDKIFEDLLDSDFVNVFKPCFFVQKLFGTLGVNIEYKFITPATRSYKIYSCVTWLINSACIVHAVIFCNTQFDAVSTDIPLKVGIVLNGFVNTILIWRNIFYDGHSRCQLYVKLQKIERSLKIRNVKSMNGKLLMMSWILVMSSFFLYVVWIIFFNNYLLGNYCPTATVGTVMSSAIYYEMYHVFTILCFISLRMQYVNNKIMEEKVNSTNENLVFTFDLKAKVKDRIGDELVHGVFDILDSFSDTMDIFPHAIFLFTFQMLAWQLISMQNLVISFKKQMSVNLTSFLCTLPSSIAFMILILLLCSISQSLMKKMETCSELCTTLSFSSDEGKSRENSKRIALLLKGKRTPTVFDIFTLDNQLPLSLFWITASYTIVLLQLAAL